MKRISIKTLGCKLNQAESEDLARALVKHGFRVSFENSKADLYVVNSCSITKTAEKKSRQAIALMRKQNSKAKILLVGCAKSLADAADYFEPEKKNIAAKVSEILSPRLPNQQSEGRIDSLSRTRSYIKIQDGCDNFCSYCVIPYLRGPLEDVPTKEIIEKIQDREKQNYKEVILTGVNILKYGRKAKGLPRLWLGKAGKSQKAKIKQESSSLVELIRRILKETKIPRIRLGSIDPGLVDEEFLELFQDSRMMPHLHLSLQSGSSPILKRMNRKYTVEEYFNIVVRVREKYPNFGITTDIIVGFPGETEDEFKETLDFAAKCKFSKIHIFRYSPRPGTAASHFKEQISEKTKIERSLRLKKLGKALETKFEKSLLGQTFPVLFEHEQKGLFSGYTPNYLRVSIRSDRDLANRIVRVRMGSIE